MSSLSMTDTHWSKVEVPTHWHTLMKNPHTTTRLPVFVLYIQTHIFRFHLLSKVFWHVVYFQQERLSWRSLHRMPTTLHTAAVPEWCTAYWMEKSSSLSIDTLVGTTKTAHSALHALAIFFYARCFLVFLCSFLSSPQFPQQSRAQRPLLPDQSKFVAKNMKSISQKEATL